MIAEQAAAIAEQAAAIAELAARLERLVSRNNGNSWFPPSMDAQPGRKRTGARRRPGDGGRGEGKQPGAPGSFLAWSADPGERIQAFPEGTCGCSAALAGAADLGVVASHQQVEIPLVGARVIQCGRHAVACSCGKICQAPPPAGAGSLGTVTHGPNLQAWCVYLMVAHAIPVRAGPGPAWRKRHLLVAATPLLTHYMLGDRARYRGTRKNLFDLRRAAVVHYLHVIARQPAAPG